MASVDLGSLYSTRPHTCPFLSISFFFFFFFFQKTVIYTTFVNNFAQIFRKF